MSTKLLVAAYPEKKQAGRSFVVPDVISASPSGFVGLDRPLTVRVGMVAYTGATVSADQLVERFWTSPSRKLRPGAAELLAQFIERVQDFRIGNLISIAYDEQGGFELRKEADRLEEEHRPRLPG